MELKNPLYLILLIMIPILILWYYKQGNNKEAALRISSKQFLSKRLFIQARKNNFIIISYFV